MNILSVSSITLSLVLLSGICSANFIVYHKYDDIGIIYNRTYKGSYVDRAYIPSMDKLYKIVTNISDCDKDSILITMMFYTPEVKSSLLSLCSGIITVDREIYYGVSSPASYPELSGLLDDKFVIMSPASSVLELYNVISNLSDVNGSSIAQIGHTTFRPWHDSYHQKLAILICCAGFSMLIGYMIRIYDMAIRNLGMAIFTRLSISAILHLVFFSYIVLGICYILDPFYSVGIFSPSIAVIINVIPFCVPGPCLFILAFYWKDSLDSMEKFRFVTRYGPIFITFFAIFTLVMIIMILAGAFIRDMSNFYPFIRIMTIIIASVNGIVLIIYLIYIILILIKVNKSNYGIKIYVVINQIIVVIGVASQLTGCVFQFTGLSEVGDLAGYYNSYNWILYRWGEILCLFAVCRQLGEFKQEKARKSTRVTKGSSDNQNKSGQDNA